MSGQLDTFIAGAEAVEGSKIVTASALLAADHGPDRFLVADYIPANGAVVVLASWPKVGKSTLLSHITKQVEDGGLVAGRLGTTRARSLVLALEERERDVQARYRSFGLKPGQGVDFIFKRPTPEQLRRALSEGRYGLCVIDTLSVWWAGRVSDENSNAAVHAECDTLRDIARDTGASLVLAHHVTKAANGRDKDGRGVRGASSLIGAVDGILEFGKVEGRVSPGDRLLTATTRWPAPPDRVLTFDRGSFQYAVSREYTDDSPPSADALTRLANLLQSDWHERKKLPELIGKTDRTLRRYLDSLRNSTHYSLEEDGNRLRLVDRGES